MNMIEKVARALTEVQIRSANELFKLSDPRRVRTEEQIIASIDAGWRMNVKDARAAIEAMREPEAEMLGHGDDAIFYSDFDHRANACWKAMIEAALGEENKE